MPKNVFTTQPPAKAVHLEKIVTVEKPFRTHGDLAPAYIPGNDHPSVQVDELYHRLSERLAHYRSSLGLTKKQAEKYDFHLYGVQVVFTADNKTMIASGTLFGLLKKSK